MTDTNTANDVLDFPNTDKPKVPSTLNVLTILTFIGCGISLIFALATPALLNFSLKMMDRATTMGDQISDKQLADIQKARPAIEAALQNMVPIIIVSIVGVILCVVGAIWMRKFKKDGYWLYIAGELLPIVTGVILLGKYQFVDWKSYLNFIIPIVFIILYTAQRKYLTQ